MNYVSIILFIVFLSCIFTPVLAILRWREKRRFAFRKELRSSEYLVLIIIQSVIDAFSIGFIVFTFCAMTYGWYYRILFILLGIIIEITVVFWMLQIFNVKRVIICGCITVFLFAGIAGGVIYEHDSENKRMREYFDFRTYIPFTKDSLVVKLDEESTLKFSDSYGDLPHMDGATALYPVYAAFAQATYPESLSQYDSWIIEDIVDCTTTGSAYKKIVDGSCDIIFVAGPSEEQEAYAAQKGVTLEYIPIGREAFVFFVNPKNPIEDLSLQQIQDIYSGKITKWTELGVRGMGKIQAFQREEGSGSQTALKRFVMRDVPLMTARKETTSDGMGGMVERVSAYRNNRGAIGYSFRFYTTELMSGFQVKLLSVNGVAPTVENIENGTYALASEFYAVVRSDASDNTRALLEWICGPQGQELVRKAGYTPVGAK